MSKWKGNRVLGRRPVPLDELGSDAQIIEHIGAAEQRIHTLEVALRKIADGYIDNGGNRRNYDGATVLARRALGLGDNT